MNKNSIVKFYKQNIVKNKITEIQLFGSSMLPTIKSGERLKIFPAQNFNIGEILVVNNKNRNNFIVHRVVEIDNLNKKIRLLGDNQDIDEAMWFDFNEIIGKVILSKDKNELIYNKNTKIVIALPFLNPSSFNTNSYEIYQSLKAEFDNTFYYDFNIDFQYTIYDKDKIDGFKKIKNKDLKEINNFLSYLKIVQKVYKSKYNLLEFNFDNLSECDFSDENSINNLIKNYEKSIYFNFFQSKIDELIKIHCESNEKTKLKLNLDIFLTVQNLKQLVNAVIFSQILYKNYNIKPILINDSTFFNDKYNIDFIKKYFKTIVSSSFIKSNIDKSLCSYKEINFNNYIFLSKNAQIRMSNECYYKKCMFCDRHSKDNFYFSVDNLFKKIISLKEEGINNFTFTDDCIIIPTMIKLIDKLNETNIKIKWKGTFRFESILNNTKIIEKFANSGCQMMFFGLESFDQSYLDLIKKGTKIKNCIDILKLCKKFNIKTSISFMFNFPGETIENLLKTENEFYKHKDLIDVCEINFFTLTKNCKICTKDDKINYFVKQEAISQEKMEIITRIIRFAVQERKNLSFQLKNQIFLNE